MAEQREPEGASDWRYRLAAFVAEILHGDDRHKEWLWNAAHAFAAGDPVPKPDAAPTLSNEELVAMRAVVDAAERLLLKATSPINFRRVIDEELDDLKVALARLGGRE